MVEGNAVRRRLLVSTFVLALALTPNPTGPSARAQDRGVWTAARHGVAQLHAVASPSRDTAWVVGAAGTILASADGGRTWETQHTGTARDLGGVAFVDDTTGWAVGADDTVLSTRDGGHRWQRHTSGAGFGSLLRAVDFADATTGWAVGHTAFPLVTNVVMTTRDGGTSWSRQTAPVGVGLVAVSFADRRHGFAGGFLGAAYRTTDGGATWLPMTVGAAGHAVAAVARIDERRGLAAAGQTIYRTADGGLTWSAVAQAPGAVRGLVHSDGVAVAVGDGGFALRSDDAGLSWATEPAGTAAHLSAVAIPAPSAAVAVGNGGTVATYRVGAGPQPLDLADDPQSCADLVDDTSDERLGLRWTSPAAGYPVAALSADLTGDGAREVVVSGPEGVRALRPGHPTDRATLWTRAFQARARQVLLADVTGTGKPAVVVAAAAERPNRSGVAVLDGATGTPMWSRQLPGGALLVRTADVDGSGSDDLVVITQANALSVLSGASGADLRPPRALAAPPRDLQVGRLGTAGQPTAVVALADGTAIAIDLAADRVTWSYDVAAGTLEAVTLADVTGDSALEAILGGSGSPAALTSPGYEDALAVGAQTGPVVAVVRGADGQRVWDWGVPAGGTGRIVAVATGDLTGDGVDDVVAHVAQLGQGHLVALLGSGQQVAGRSTGEPHLLWSADVTHGSGGAQATYTPEGLVVGDGDGDGLADAYVSSWSGALLGVAGGRLRGGGGVVGGPAHADRLFTIPRRPPHTHASLHGQGQLRHLLTATGDNLVALRDPATGAPLWRYDAGGPPALAVGVGPTGGVQVAVGSASGRVYGLDAHGIALQPDRDAFLPHQTAGIAAVPATGDDPDASVAASVGGAVAAVDPRTSRPLWDVTLGTGVTAVAAVGEQLVAVGTTDGRVVALDARTGAIVWEHAGGSAVRALADAPVRGVLAAGDAAGGMRLLDHHGAVRGQGTTGGGAVSTLVAADVDSDGPEEFVAASGHTIQGFSASGQRLWRYTLGGAASYVSAGDLTGDGVVAVVGTGLDGRAHAIDGRTGARLWSLPNGWPGPTAVADLDGDGRGVAVVSSSATPDSPPAGRRTVRTVDAHGQVLTVCTVRKAPHVATVADLDGDGAEEVLVGMEQGDVYAFGGRSGAPQVHSPDAGMGAPAPPPPQPTPGNVPAIDGVPLLDTLPDALPGPFEQLVEPALPSR